MAKFKSMLVIMLGVMIMTGSAVLMGCGGGVGEEEMAQLNNLKTAVETLQKQVDGKKQERDTLQKQISDKESRLKKCNDDVASTQACLDAMMKEAK